MWRDLLTDEPATGDEPDALELLGDRSACVRVGADALRWILRHLLDNARRYGRGAVVIRIEGGAEHVRVEVASDGDPLPAPDLENAFEAFYRGEAAVMASASGLGLGLPVARTLAEHAGGTLALHEGVEGHGAVAGLELPA